MIPKNATVSQINAFAINMLKHLAIEFTEVGEDFVSAKMPVDERTQQPMGLLHGGASVVLAESLGSVAGQLCVEEGQYCVGLEINANHLKSVKSGFVYGTAKPIHVGKRTQVWEIRIVDEADDLVCISRITLAVIDKRKK
jgi:1,4-dihydroxy-2-naphthoyl-CoA hydrolase